MAAEEVAEPQESHFHIRWDSILGHGRQKDELRRLLSQGRLPHALLLTGPEGVGKKLLGRVLAAAVLCEHQVDGTPCGRCPSCRAMESASHPDYYELLPEVRGKGTRIIRIESIRELTELAARYPVMSDRRVLLIDEVDLMNEPAANSLLKTLEEPPGEVTFILVTAARSALLDTIISRCMPLAFGVLAREDIAAALVKRGAAGEQAAEIAALSDGSLGRALQMYASGGLERRDSAIRFLEGLRSLGMTTIWREAEAMEKWGREELAEWLLYLNMSLRDMLVLYEDGSSPLIYQEDCRARLAALLPDFPVRKIFLLLACVKEMQKRLGTNVNLRLQLEGLFIRMKDVSDR